MTYRGIMPEHELRHYLDVVIPNAETKLADKSLSTSEKLEIYNLYKQLLGMVARDDFISFNKLLELEEPANNPNKKFYHHRKEILGDVFQSLNDMEIYDLYDILLIMMPPRIGKTQTNIRFLAWISGRYPEQTQLGTSYSDAITTSFYLGVMEIVQLPEYKLAFPEANLVAQNANREEIWLKRAKRYPTISFVPINGSMTGRGEAGNYLSCDDLVSGIEEAVSITRLNKLWKKYTVNAKQRKKDGCKEIHIATPWSVHDPITRINYANLDNPRAKIIKKSCYDEDGNSAFDFFGGFSTRYYKTMEKDMDSASFSALYLQEPIEREGLLYKEDELQYYFELPNKKPQSVISVCDSKNMGKDYVAMPIAYMYDDGIYIEDVVFDNGLPEITTNLVNSKLLEHNVVRTDIEMNNGGNYYAEKVEDLNKSKYGKTAFRLFFSSNNKDVKIITYSDLVKKRFFFKHRSKYEENSPYGKFMRQVLSWTQTGKNAHDDAPDSLAMLAQLVDGLEGSKLSIINRKDLGL